MKHIICLSHNPWSSRPNRTQQLLTRLDNVQILFFEPAGRSKSRKKPGGLRVRSNIIVYSLPQLSGSGSLEKRQNQDRITLAIERIMERHRFREPVLWCTSPENFFLVDSIAYRCLIYDCHRQWNSFPPEWEISLASAADIIFAASPGLQARLQPYNDNIALIPNGVIPRMFLRSDLSAPESISHLPAPIFVRVGDLTADLELEPLIRAAKQHPDWTFLMLGRITPTALKAVEPLPNVVLRGPVAAVDLPDYLSGCQVMFDLIHTRRRGSDVISSRIYEYLATGKPIVTVMEPGQPEPFSDVIYSAYDAGGFLQRCESALAEQDEKIRDKRLNYAAMAAWAGRAGEVSRILLDSGLF